MLHASKAVFVSAACSFLLLAIVSLNAANQGGLQGYFDFRQVTVSNDQVSLTLDVRIFNHTGGDIHTARITVQNSLVPNGEFGSFPEFSIASGQAADLTQTLNLPQREFQRWQTGATPQFVISYVDANGSNVQGRIELIRRPLKGGK